MNLAEDVQDILSKAAGTFGMWRGPFSHAALSSPFWRSGYSLQCEEPWWQEKMAERCPSLTRMVAERLVNDWRDTPAGLRKTADSQVVMDLFIVCQVFHIYMDELENLVGAPSCKDVEDLEDAFLLHTFDVAFKTDAKNQPMPLDITKVAEFGAVVQRHKTSLQYAEVEKRKELKLQVEGATYNKLAQDLLDDVKLVQGTLGLLKFISFEPSPPSTIMFKWAPGFMNK